MPGITGCLLGSICFQLLVWQTVLTIVGDVRVYREARAQEEEYLQKVSFHTCPSNAALAWLPAVVLSSLPRGRETS
jgi:hypothetical protein